MTTKAIEAGARACYDKFNENLIGCCEPAWDELSEDFRKRLTDAFEAGLQTALASGELVPASAVAAERERCALLCENTNPVTDEPLWHGQNLAQSIRALPQAPASGEFVVVPRTISDARLNELLGREPDSHITPMFSMFRDFYEKVVNAATKDGERA